MGLQAIVVGAGKLGFEVARRLSDAGHDVVVVDRDAEALAQAADRLDVMTLVGHGSSPSVLRKAGVASAQLLIAATDSDELNIVTCMTAKTLGEPFCVARIRNPEYSSPAGAAQPGRLDLARLGIDRVVRPEDLAAKEIIRMLRTPSAAEVEYFAGDRAAVVSFAVDEHAPAAGRSVTELGLTHTVVAAVIREAGTVEIPSGSTVIHPGDRIYFMGRAGNFQEARRIVGREEHPMRSLVIVGGSPLGYEVAQFLGKMRRTGLSIRIIERDRERCRELAEQLPPAVMVLAGDAARPDLLEDEHVAQSDACILTTGDDHRNLLVGMMLKGMGVRYCISELSREEYLPLAHRAGIDACVVPRLVTASFILQLTQRRNVRNLALVEEGKAEILELEAESGCPAEGRPIGDLRLPPSAVVGIVVREGEVLIPRGATRIQAGDQVLLFLRPEGVDAVQHLFRQG
ncbi:potassium transporter TrkA [Limnochorda pilosa]|uniref:Trk system potassium uptake protein TrkA n=1 Tax=Limnochorda pilosa TaxID=1555112 RepID=A0A0K2SNE5_LIMPI|nr:potassium transporter TrkA [Limnochorda pilosa]